MRLQIELLNCVYVGTTARKKRNKRNCGRVLIGAEEVWGYEASEETAQLRLRWYHCQEKVGKHLSRIQGIAGILRL
ncbi:hypothetical protein CEXT_158231 [Caerostris extrusa]|uniref:Uncharacterized protein n=1 Tax=Caerostris extrusa TaxID=172846 RepID=A0AAV4XGI6_CAEEX|nr:hypothetical protein CEXT_158231 [Caerostris extrusa]